MTREEKAVEAARVIKEEIGMSEHSISRVAEIIDWCLTWKDAQFREYLEKKKSVIIDLRERWQPDSYEFGVYDGQIDILDGVINKLFKED